MLFTVLSSGWFYRKPLWFRKSKKIHKTRKLESIYEQHFVEWKNEDRKPDKKSSLRNLEFMSLEPEKFWLEANHQPLITHRVRSLFLFLFETGN
jgi:hypothetical protein